MTTAATIRAARAALGLSQAELAAALTARGVGTPRGGAMSQSAIRDLERGRIAPYPDVLAGLLAELQERRPELDQAIRGVQAEIRRAAA